MFNENMEDKQNGSKKNLPVVRQAFHGKKTTTNYCSPQCSKRGYKHRMKERRMELREIQEMLELKRKLESQEYFTFLKSPD